MGILAANCWLGHSPPCRKSQRGTDRNGDYSYFAGLAGGGRGWQQSCQLRLEGGRLSRTAFAWKPRRDRHGCAGFLLFGLSSGGCGCDPDARCASLEIHRGLLLFLNANQKPKTTGLHRSGPVDYPCFGIFPTSLNSRHSKQSHFRC